MSPEQWRLVRSLLEAALERREEERRGFLDAACPDPELRREVSSLLAVESAARDFIETPVFDLHGERAPGQGGPEQGGPATRIGHADDSRGGSFARRAGRRLRRHRWASAGAALGVALLAGFAVREAALKRSAEAALAQARAAADFLVGTFEQADPTRSAGAEVTVRQMLAGAVARLRADEDLAPSTRAELLDALGRAYLGLGLHDAAQPLLEEALATRRRELGGDHPEVAESHERLFHLHQERSDARAAEEHLREVLAIRRRSGEVEHTRYAQGLNGLARILEHRGDLAEAERLHLEILALKRRLLGDHHPDLAATLHDLAGVRLALGEAGAAAELYRQALAIRRAGAGDPDHQVAASLHGLAAALEAAGDGAAAESHLREAEEIQRRLHGAGGGTPAGGSGAPPP